MSGKDPDLDAAGGALGNKFGLARPADLDIVERRFVTQRIAEGAPQGGFDLRHLRAIHRHLFQDLFEWAGDLRAVELEKDGEHFQRADRLAGDLDAIHRDLAGRDFLRGLAPGDFARELAGLAGDLHFVQPFREGGGQALMLYLKQLAQAAGHPLDLARIPAEPWIEALRASLAGDMEPMAGLITFALD